MTDETRDEIVRLARKGMDAQAIASELYLWDDGQVEQVQAVIDEADREVERMLTPTVGTVPRTNPKIGRSGRQMRMKAIIGEVVRQGKTDWLAEQMVGGPVTWKQMRKLYMNLGLEW